MNEDWSNIPYQSVNLYVFFEDPFWIGIFERMEECKLSVLKVTFGAKPKEMEVQEFILNHYYELKFSQAVETEKKEKGYINPKRKSREARKQQLQAGVGTKSQQALKLQHEQMKTERKTDLDKRREEKEKRLFELKKQKRKEKHRGR